MSTYGDVKALVVQEIGRPRVKGLSKRYGFGFRVILVTEFFRAEQGFPPGVWLQSGFFDDIELGVQTQQLFDELRDWYNTTVASSMQEKPERKTNVDSKSA